MISQLERSPATLFTLMLVVICLPISLQANEEFGWYYTDGGVYVDSYWGNDTEVVIPSQIEGQPVVAIMEYDDEWETWGMFFVRKEMENTITSITIPDSVTYIDGNLFDHITSLNNFFVDAENSHYSSLDGVLSNKDKTSLIAFPSGREGDYVILGSIQSIEPDAFYGSNSLTSVTIPENIASMPDNIFRYSSGLSDIFVVSANSYYSSLDGVLFSKDATSLLAFPGNRDGEYVIPVSVEFINDNAFRSCNNLTSVFIPDSVITIGHEAFRSCSNLTSVFIPNSVTTIGNQAFQSCSSLSSVTISDSVTSIAGYTFRSCSNLTRVVIPDNVTSIGTAAFHSCSNLTNIVFPNSITYIGRYAFSGCTNLSSVIIPDSVTTVENGAFSRCSNLTGLTIGDRVTTINDHTFSSCTSLTSVIIPEGVTSIGSHAFIGCNNLVSVHIPEGVTSIGRDAFRYCSSLRSTTIPSSVTSIGDLAFRGANIGSIYFMGEPPTLNGSPFQSTPDELVLYYVEGTLGWGATFEGIPTAPFTPWGRYIPITSELGTHTDTGNWMGILEVTHDPWIWCDTVSCWFNIPEKTASVGNGWVYPSNEDNLLIVQIDGTNWGYSFASDKWLYLTAIGWVYMM